MYIYTIIMKYAKYPLPVYLYIYIESVQSGRCLWILAEAKNCAYIYIGSGYLTCLIYIHVYIYIYFCMLVTSQSHL